MKKNVFSTIVKSIVLGAFSIALLFSCQNPLTVQSNQESSRATVYNDYREWSQDPPGGLTPAQVPQFVVFGYDDNQYADGMHNIMDLYKGRFNPMAAGNPYTFDGTPTTASFYVVPSGYDASTGETWSTSQDAVDSWKYAYRRGHEIGNHTWDHRSGGLSRSAADWEWQISKCQDFIVNKMGIPAEDVIGFRTPFLEYNTNTFNSMKANGLEYDVSFEGGWRTYPAEDGSTLYWPATMDNGIPPGESGRNFGIQTGLWEIPNDCVFFPGGKTTGFDYNLWFSKSTTTTQFVDILKYSLDKKYNGNRSPMKFGTHTNYYSIAGDAGIKQWDPASYNKLRADVAGRIDGIKQFLDYAQTKPDVRIVTAAQLLEWLRNPVALADAPAVVHTISASSGIGGIISPEGSQIYVPGTSVTYYIDNEKGYHLENVMVDGVDMGKIYEYTFSNISSNHSISATFSAPSTEDKKRSSILSMTSIAENSQTTLKFDYAENIQDGRGITFGAVGFTSGTWDGTLLLKRLQSLEPTHPLCSYIPAFEAIDALPHPDGKCDDVTGLDNFIADFNKYGNTDIVRGAQISMLEELYYNPTLAFYNDIGATLPITEGFLYDSCVNHGAESWEQDKGLDKLIEETNAAVGGTPKTGVNEIVWLKKLMEIRKAYLLSDATWQMAEERVTMYQNLLDTGNTSLTNPFDVSCYGGHFTIYGHEVEFPELPKFTLTINVGPGGSAVPSGIFEINQGSGTSVKIKAPAGKVIDTIKLDGVIDPYFGGETETTYYFKNVQANHTLEVTFRDPASYIVTVNAGPNGSATPATATVIEGNDLVITLAPDVEYAVDTITVNTVLQTIDPTSETFTLLNVKEAKTVDITFKYDPRPRYNVVASAEGNGTISPSGTSKVPEGDDITYTFAPAAEFMISTVTVNNVEVTPVNNSYTIAAVSADTTIKVVYVAIPTCTHDEYVHGTVYHGGAVVHHNGADYQAKWWTQWEEPPGESGVWLWLQDCGPTTVTYYDVTATAGNGGSIDPAGTQTVIANSDVTYIITPAAGYKIADVTVNGVSKGKVTTVTFTVTGNTTVSATFVEDIPLPEYTLTVTQAANGTISPVTTIVEQGSSQTFTITANAGYKVSDVIVDGVSKGPLGSYTFTNVSADGSITAAFIIDDNPTPPEWAYPVDYAVGDEVTYNGVVYVCKYAHTSNSAWIPGTPGLWIWEAK